MKVIPAIDLMKGKVVRLSQGDPKTAKVYDYLGEPMEVAKKWKKDGASALHIIDLDAALSMGDNFAVIGKIVKVVDLPVQVGGGIRKLEVAERLLALGVNRVILGTLAFDESNTISETQKKFGYDRVIVALDNRDGKIMIDGWKTRTGYEIEEALVKFSSLQVKTFLITSITKDGTLSSPDFHTLKKACAHPDVKIIAAGGVGSLKDLATLKSIGVEAVVIGKALYEGVFTLEEAMKVANGARNQ